MENEEILLKEILLKIEETNKNLKAININTGVLAGIIILVIIFRVVGLFTWI